MPVLTAAILISWVHYHTFNMTFASTLCFPSFFSFFLFFVFFPHIYSSLREMHGRRIRHCHLCPLCSRYLAFLTSMEASWLGRSLHCWNTRNLWTESWLTPLESPQTGREHNGCKKGKLTYTLCEIIQLHNVNINLSLFYLTLISRLPLPVLYQLWRGSL